MIPLQEKVDNILVIVTGKIGKRCLQFEAIPDHTTIYFLWLRHTFDPAATHLCFHPNTCIGAYTAEQR